MVHHVRPRQADFIGHLQHGACFRGFAVLTPKHNSVLRLRRWLHLRVQSKNPHAKTHGGIRRRSRRANPPSPAWQWLRNRAVLHVAQLHAGDFSPLRLRACFVQIRGTQQTCLHGRRGTAVKVAWRLSRLGRGAGACQAGSAKYTISALTSSGPGTGPFCYEVFSSEEAKQQGESWLLRVRV